MKHKEQIAAMTLEEKALLVSGKDFWQTQELDSHGVESMFFADGPSGLRKQAAAADHLGLNVGLPATCFPSSATLANSWNEKLLEEVGTALGEEAAALGVNVLLGPGVNLKRDPRCGRNFEYYSEDPYLAGKCAAAAIRGIQSAGVSACVKHFAANSQELRRMAIDSVVDERTLRELYLTAFEIAVKEGKTKTLMSSYNPVNGVYANENAHLLRDVLRGEWGYDGVVVTDWGGNNDPAAAIAAGSDLEMPGTAGESSAAIVKAVREGQLDEVLLDETVDRLITLMEETRDARNSASVPPAVSAQKEEEHHAIARRAAAESVVLLENNGILPLPAGARVAVIGDFACNPRYQGAGSSNVNPIQLESALELLGDYGLSVVGYAQGYKRYGQKSEKLAKEACELAKKADVILLYIGLDEVTESEGLDRESIDLPANQIELLDRLRACGRPLVAVLSCGCVLKASWAGGCSALVYGALGGQAGAGAVLDVITGRENPSGKLSETWPMKLKDVPCYGRYPATERTSEYREGLYVGYRYYDTGGVPVRYPFGYGLSYTQFEYSDVAITEKAISFRIKNTGSVAGGEIAQLYVSKPDAKIFRPAKELKGFTKVFLEPGGEKAVQIPFDDKTFRYFNVKTNRWEIEGGSYLLQIGASSADIRLQVTTEVAGTDAPNPYEDVALSAYKAGAVRYVTDEEFEALLGRPIPPAEFVFFLGKKNRMVLGYNDTLAQMKYAKGAFARFVIGAMEFVEKTLRACGKRAAANTFVMGVYHLPFRGIARMAGGMVNMPMVDGVLTMCNRGFWPGIVQVIRAFVKKGEKK